MYDDILVPTDGSESFDAVLEHTIEIATGREATIHILYVIDDQAFLTLDEKMKDDVIEDLRASGKNAIRAAVDTLEEADLDVVTSIRRGKPADEIVSYAEDEQIDLVTMGTQGEDYTENILGSTSETVVARSSVPVLTVNVSDR